MPGARHQPASEGVNNVETKPPGRQLVCGSVVSGAFDEVLAKADSGRLELIHAGGTLPAVSKEVLEEGFTRTAFADQAR